MTPPEFTQQDAIRQRDVLMKMLSQIGEALGRQHWSGGPAGFSAHDVIERLMPPGEMGTREAGNVEQAEVEASVRDCVIMALPRLYADEPAGIDTLVEDVTALVDAAVARERERCAEMAAEGYCSASGGCDMPQAIAADIRQAPRP